MRKALVCMSILLVLAVAGVVTAGVVIGSADDQVTYERQVIYGDPKEAENLTVQVKSEFTSQLFWNTTYETGEGSGEEPVVETEYTFYDLPERRTREWEYTGIHLEASVSTALDQVRLWQYDPDNPDQLRENANDMTLMCLDLFEELAPGEELETTVRIKDYFEYYPLSIDVDLPGYHWNSVYDDLDLDNGMPRKHAHAFEEFFRIPVLEDEELQIHLTKQANGYLGNWGGGSGVHGDSFYMSTWRLVDERYCYFTFDPHTSQGNVVDTSLIPGGYGIYRVPYHTESAADSRLVNGTPEDRSVLEIEKLELAYPLDPEEGLCIFSFDPERKHILLVTNQGLNCILRVIRLSDMELVDQLEVTSFTEENPGAAYEIYQREDMIVLWLSDGRLAVLERQAAGRYQMQFVVEHQIGEFSDHYLNMSTTSMDWNGEKLVVAGTLMSEKKDRTYYSPGFYLAVYDRDGIQYYGEYDSSLNTGWDTEAPTYYIDVDQDPVTVNWDR